MEDQNNNSNKKKKARIFGLAGAPPDIRKKVAQLGGLTRAEDKAGLSKAGKRGGMAIKESYGIEYYRELGARGGATTLERYSVTYFSELGKKGNISKRSNNINKRKKQKS